ncbi:MAG: hypothetical protein JW809_04340 [Pirellulales bacterium]|nr:hypothetical protein [Pirellulales bacterium]
MAATPPNTPADMPPPIGRWRGVAWPPWLLSLVLHAGLIVILGVSLKLDPRAGAPGHRLAEVGIALKHQDGPRAYFTSETDSAGDRAAAESVGALGREALFENHATSDPGESLPKAPDAIGMGALGHEGVGDAGQATRGSVGRRGSGKPGGARVSVFGAVGEGHKFVYVFDRSGSMGGVGRTALEAAKAELLSSLDSLESTHQFQIVFYNERPWAFNPSGQAGRLAFGTDRNKELARRFTAGVTADGATRHEEALLLAIRMRPDVIFFLTDADEPRLSPRQLDKIVRQAGGIQINTIEFSFGPRQDPDNFLVRLARACGGQHAYVDVSRLGEKP